MLNIGPAEVLVLVIIALVVVGPNRLPEMGRMVGKGLRYVRKVQDEVRDMVDTSFDDEWKSTASDLRDAVDGVRKAADPRSLFPTVPHASRPGIPESRPTFPDEDLQDGPSEPDQPMPHDDGSADTEDDAEAGAERDPTAPPEVSTQETVPDATRPQIDSD
jgi:Tat protein translocase TatB subunit